MYKILGLSMFITALAGSAFAQVKPNAEGSIGFGTTVDSTDKKTGMTYTAVVEFRAFSDKSYDTPLFFANISSLYNVMGKSGYDKTTFGVSGNVDLFVGHHLGEGDGKPTTTIYYGAVGGLHGTAQTASQVTRQGWYDLGAETGILVLTNNQVFTASPIVVLAGIGARFEAEDGGAPLTPSVGNSAALAGGFKARYIHSNRFWGSLEYIGRPDGGTGSENNLPYGRIYSTARVRLTQKLSVGGEYKRVQFESIDGAPLKIRRLSGNVTVIF